MTRDYAAEVLALRVIAQDPALGLLDPERLRAIDASWALAEQAEAAGAGVDLVELDEQAAVHHDPNGAVAQMRARRGK